ncbi:MAG: winged helix-turn-helix transcriptional regulator [Methanoculleus bourgensis]|jgi:DNA-binding MarR family transcriptional regulator|uniref:MarR family transcriptional regulator n=2 Tax=Methanoculleus bourgensis TaxID=83986 RepID=A0A0X3BI98_9EURY|nr:MULTISPECIES: MarR family winged helix-turn-helix transcriptional regulator [Methanoculleus]MDD3373311.1 MarR family winged helix-turn-helix transcriptional regulator [Methanoculleus bourgensis]NMA87930.1 winged helix-turn-helix transcriptional regulator [Methanoculleus bourgensis]NQS77122.1 winged helix-turn-helix transcriptional regulator [Methanoculleus bourgensis]CVK31265.1 MarR family transcriptional regulator [Methanoculleus bourgensis]SAI86925.1 MarR family transcriptional regulator 
MSARVEHLVEAFGRLMVIKNECSSEIFSECGLTDLTVTQIAYLKAIDEHHDVTFSRLAEITRTSKPTVTEMVNRFVRMECAYRQKCPDDGRVTYIRLTERGRMIANAEQNALHRMIERIVRALDENEVDLLLEILKKVG